MAATLPDNTGAPPLAAERALLARLTKRGLGMPLAGLCYWIAVSAILANFPLKRALVISFAATGAVFPLGALLTRAFGGDLFAKSPTLTPLGLQLAAVQLFYWPVIIVLFRLAPEWTPFAIAVLFGSHFLPYWWFYESRGYALLAVLTIVASCTAVLVSGSPLTQTMPLIAAGCYAVACAVVWIEVKGDERRRSS